MTTNSKSLLAKLLATEDIKIRRNPAARTASFDVKHRVLEMPIWKGVSEDLEDMLTVHETGHALDTPPDGWLEAIDSIVNKHHDKPSGRQKKAVHGFLNVIEDARIDKRQKRRYPGSRRNYIVGYKELIERGFFGPPNKDLNTYSFIDRVNMYFKGGFASGIKFSPEEMPFVRRIEAAETFADVIAMTDEVYGFAKERGEEEAEQQALPDMNMDDMDMEDMDFDDDMRDSSGSSYDDDGEEESDDDSDDSDDSDDQGDQGDQGEGDISAQDKEKPDGVNGQDPRDMMDHDNGEYTPESETDNVWQEKQLELSDTSTEYVYVTTPKPILNRIVDDYKVFLAENEEHFSSLPYTYGTVQEFITKDFMDFKMKENNTISFMVKEFEMRKAADLYSRISISKTGVIDTNKLHSYKYNDDIFRRLSVLPQGKNHGFVMFLDWSGSMCDNIKATVKQLVGLVLFCKRVQIPFEVYIFRNLNNMSKEQYTANEPFFEYKETDMVFTPFKIRNILSSRMSITELGRAFNILWTLSNKGSQVEPMGNTPLNGAIVVATDLVNQFRARNKVQVVNTIFLTDGDSDMILGIHGEVKTFTPTPLPEHIKSRKYAVSYTHLTLPTKA